MKHALLLLSMLPLFSSPAAQPVLRPAETRRQLARIQPEAVRLALEDMAARWPQRCGQTDRAWCATLG
ncbi:MAG: hypothetical protein GX565_12210, partial [Lentisphaerae bacterium]|nr:hypothetical protein [Lentisphaerota bacterium]